MSWRVRVDPRARRDARWARAWYAERSPEAATAFDEDVHAVLSRLATHPEVYRVRFGDVRQALLRRFPYFVVFRIRGECVEVFALVHALRGPSVAER